MKQRNLLLAALSLSAVAAMSAASFPAPHDPGPRGGPGAGGGPLAGLSASEIAFYQAASSRFAIIDSVSGTIAGEEGKGLGPTFNGNSCSQCHAQPNLGGSSPGLSSPQNPVPNPQVALANLNGATNFIPSFIKVDGPVRAAHFVRNPNGTLDGQVHGLYTIAGRTDAPGCTLAQPDFETQLAHHNVVWRIPAPTFGLGLVENTPDATLIANLAANSTQKAALGIHGSMNVSANDGTVTRFGWKAQDKSLLMFAGEAFNVEQGVSNELFPNKRSMVPGCSFTLTPEDSVVTNGQSGSASEMSSDTENVAVFMRFSAPALPGPQTPSTQNGARLFDQIGCALCHTQSLTTGKSPYAALSNFTYFPYSDFALHHMGSGLADGVQQGAAGPDQFRTAPLWGLGQRLFFLHDGRTADLLQAIIEHDCTQSCGSEASGVVKNFRQLSPNQQQDILNFLRSL